MGKQVVFVVLDQFADWEGAFLSAALVNGEISKGNDVYWASIDKAPKKSIGGMTMLPDLSLDEIPEDVDALILIGGNSWRTEEAKKVIPVVQKFKDQGKVLGFICDAAYFAASAGFLNQVRHTGNDPQEVRGASGYSNPDNFLLENAVSDGRVITANGNNPVEFAAEVLRAIEAAAEDDIRMWTDFYTVGYWTALKKYGYLE